MLTDGFYTALAWMLRGGSPFPGRMIRARLEVNRPGDCWEREADRAGSPDNVPGQSGVRVLRPG